MSVDAPVAETPPQEQPTSRRLRRAQILNWRKRGGSLAARRKLPASFRTRLAVRNPDTGRLDSHSYADIATHLDAMNKASEVSE